jgi:hypothetical protein
LTPQTSGAKCQETFCERDTGDFHWQRRPHFTFPRSVTDGVSRSAGRRPIQPRLAKPTTQLASRLVALLPVTRLRILRSANQIQTSPLEQVLSVPKEVSRTDEHTLNSLSRR